MKCPYCQAEMKAGHVTARGGSGMHWLPDHETLPFIVTDKKVHAKQGLTLWASEKVWSVEVEAEVCMACRKLIISF